MSINNLIKDAIFETPDPEKASKNFERLLREAPEIIEEHIQYIDKIAKLFSYSQFLSDYIHKNPSNLSLALSKLNNPISKKTIIDEVLNKFSFSADSLPDLVRNETMRLLREIKKNYLLIITIKDISGISTLHECMSELSILAEVIIELALNAANVFMRKIFGLMRENSFALIGMGKLGAGELNYSSDIDIMAVYRSDEGLSTGILNPFGIRCNKISPLEYFCRLTEIFVGLLQTITEDGIAYRVDLRLRPNGQKGPISLSLNSYIVYYESWGKTWERMALIRARHVGGYNILANTLINAIEPFVWKKSIEYNDIEEIKELKKKIDTIFDVNDIKHGYGGIREIEFFIHTFQLIYGGERKNLRTRHLIKAIDELMKDGFLSLQDAKTLKQSYYFLRRLEHILQMKDDLQTYSLPSDPDELLTLSKKLHFKTEKEFNSELRLKRLMVRDMYNSLLGNSDATQEVILSLKDSLPDGAISEYLYFKGFKEPASAFKNINSLNEQISSGKTLRERTLLRKAIPLFLEKIVKSANKDKVLNMFTKFFDQIGNHESYIDLLIQRNDTREIILDTFSTSTYLARLLLSFQNLEGIFEYPDIRMDYKSLSNRLSGILESNPDPMKAIRDFKSNEELKTGLLFIKGFTDVYGFLNTLSIIAFTIIRAVTGYLQAEKSFAVVGLGGFGANELNIGSDLDLIFVCTKKVANKSYEKFAGEIIRFLSEYTKDGVVYKVDMRLRPDGSKGILVNDIEGYRNYYLKSAYPWEIQVLLRAKPIAGDIKLMKAFLELKRQMIIKRGKEIGKSYIKEIRKRIINEIARKSYGYDIKNGLGGIKEIEFLVQYLQLKYGKEIPELITQNTVTAIKRLAKYDIFDRYTENKLLISHKFLRTVETLLRLNEREVFEIDSEFNDIIVRFINLRSNDELIKQIEDTRHKIIQIAEMNFKKN